MEGCRLSEPQVVAGLSMCVQYSWVLDEPAIDAFSLSRQRLDLQKVFACIPRLKAFTNSDRRRLLFPVGCFTQTPEAPFHFPHIQREL